MERFYLNLILNFSACDRTSLEKKTINTPDQHIKTNRKKCFEETAAGFRLCI